MAEQLTIDKFSSKHELYQSLLPQLKALIDGERDIIANMANISAALKMTFNFYWVGFYIVKVSSHGEELVLGPFQGTIACTRIKFGKGVCGKAWKERCTIIVQDVNQFPGHIACDAASQSEIVIPVLDHRNDIIAVLDIDSDQLNNFDETDAEYLQQIVNLLKI